MMFRMALCGLALLLASCAAPRSAGDAAVFASLDRILAAGHRSDADRARDPFRHPKETLLFFGLRPEMTVVEVWPGSGWYTDILAPLLRNDGQLYAAQMDPSSSDYAKKLVDEYRAKLAKQPDLYGNVTVTTLSANPGKHSIAPPGSADLVVTFRNLHNWMMFGWEREALAAIHAALKPGGVLGIVEHRGAPDAAQDPKALSGYVNEDFAIELIEGAGFKLETRSEINANPQDEKNYQQGVWALPPTFAAGADDRDRYAQIGESDRFTLKFVKVQQ